VTLGDLASLAVACWHILVQSLTTPSALMVMAAFVIAGTVLAAVVRCSERASALASSSPPVRLLARRADCRAVLVLRQFDPDAAGRARPRAPGAVPTAA
jgi:hypothetical protein